MPWNVHLPPAEWYTLESEKLDGIVREVIDQPVVAIDTETTGLVTWKDIPLFWSLAWGNRRVCMPASTLPAFRRAFADDEKDWLFANAKYDCHILANVGVKLKGRLIDTQVMHALLYEEQPHGLKSMAQQILGWRWMDFFETFKPQMVPVSPMSVWDKAQKAMMRKETIGEMLLRFEREDLNKLVEYASNDAYGTLRIYEALKQQLEAEAIFTLYPDKYQTMADLFFKLEAPFTKVLFNCERHGIQLDLPFLKSKEGPAQEEMARLERKINHVVGRPLNPNSPKQLQKYFFEDLRLRPLGLSKGGKTGVRTPSVDESFLEHYMDTVEVAALVLEYRDLAKTMGTYIEGLQNRVDPHGRVHTRYNQDIARTGRLTSTDPNLQNIKKPGEDKFELRKAFIAADGYELIVADYDQLEMRLLAAASLEERMIQIFAEGKDIHIGNASIVFGKKEGFVYEDVIEAKKRDKAVKEGKLPPEAMTDRDRRLVFLRDAIKSTGYGLNYGMKENKLAKQLGVPVDEALEIIESYMSAYPAVEDFYAEAIAETHRTGYSFTLLGRRRYLPEIRSTSKMERWSAERKAGNTQLQGTAADAVRLAMLHCHYSGLEERYGCRMLLQVHDELVFECPKEHVKEVKEIIRDCMEHPFHTDLAVALPVSMGSGPNWMTAK